MRLVVKTQAHRFSQVGFKTLAILTVASGMQVSHATRLTYQDEAIKLRGELVVLDAQVLNKKTSLAIGNLVREEFILYEDGVKQHISHFSRDKLPLSVIILMDVSGSVWPNMKSFERLRRGAFEALKLLKQEDEVSLMQFAEKATLLQPFTCDRDVIVNALARLDGRGQRGTNVDIGILGAAEYVRQASNPDGRRAIIAITDDVTIAPLNRVYAVPMSRAQDLALHELYESGSVVCTLVYDTDDAPPLEDSRVQRGIAERFAEATGGISIKTSKADIPNRLTEMIERLRQRYAIGYSSSNTGHVAKFRKIKLTVTPEVEKREGPVAVITRKGYYAK